MESKLQRRILKDLADRGLFAVKVSICNKPGFPDITIFTPSVTVWFIEVKDIKGQLDPLQVHRHQELQRLGFQVFVINSWDEYQKIWGS